MQIREHPKTEPISTGVDAAMTPEEPQSGATLPPVNPQVAPAAESFPETETVSPPAAPGRTLTNGAFFKAAEPIADALVEYVDLSQFGPGDYVGWQVRFEVATAFLEAVNRARGVS